MRSFINVRRLFQRSIISSLNLLILSDSFLTFWNDRLSKWGIYAASLSVCDRSLQWDIQLFLTYNSVKDFQNNGMRNKSCRPALLEKGRPWMTVLSCFTVALSLMGPAPLEASLSCKLSNGFLTGSAQVLPERTIVKTRISEISLIIARKKLP